MAEISTDHLNRNDVIDFVSELAVSRTCVHFIDVSDVTDY